MHMRRYRHDITSLGLLEYDGYIYIYMDAYILFHLWFLRKVISMYVHRYGNGHHITSLGLLEYDVYIYI